MEGPDLTKAELQKLLNLVEGKSVKIANYEEFSAYRVIEEKILNYLSGPGLEFGGEE